MIAAVSQRPIDVLLTDVGLPGINGFQLAERMEKVFPAMRVVYVAGMAVTSETDVPNAVMIREPIDQHTVLSAVRLVLNPPLCRKEPVSAVETFSPSEISEIKTA